MPAPFNHQAQFFNVLAEKCQNWADTQREAAEGQRRAAGWEGMEMEELTARHVTLSSDLAHIPHQPAAATARPSLLFSLPQPASAAMADMADDSSAAPAVATRSEDEFYLRY